MRKSESELAALGSELRYTQATVAGELAGWQEVHARVGRRAVVRLARRVLVVEKERLANMKRALREITKVGEF